MVQYLLIVSFGLLTLMGRLDSNPSQGKTIELPVLYPRWYVFWEGHCFVLF